MCKTSRTLRIYNKVSFQICFNEISFTSQTNLCHFHHENIFVMYCISHLISIEILNFPYRRGCCWNCTFATNLKNKIEKYYHLDGKQQLAFLWKKYMSKNVGWENSRIFLRCAFSTFDLGEICLTRNEKFQFAFLTKALVNVKCQSRLGS